MHASVDRVWDLVSETDEDHKYWNSIRDIKVIRRTEDTVEREASVGPPAFGHRSRQTLVFEPKKSVRLTMTGETMTGERTIVLVPVGKNSTRVDVEWHFEMKSVPGFVGGIVKNQISGATEKALAKIAGDAERAAKAKKLLD